jgi:hypothetical protein
MQSSVYIALTTVCWVSTSLYSLGGDGTVSEAAARQTKVISVWVNKKVIKCVFD